MKKIKKIIFTLLALYQLFGLGVLPALAKFSVTGAAAKLEKRYHINKESVQNAAEYFNVSDNKKVPPEVMLTFNPSNPKIGEKVTATASPLYFSNPQESLYYTWYIKHKSGSDSVRDWKVEAMRIIASGNQDYSRFNYPADSSDESYNHNSDKDGYTAYLGGDDRKLNANNSIKDHCFVHDFTTGTNYEIIESRSETEPRLSCGTGLEPICIEDFQSNEDDFTDEISNCKKSNDVPFCSGNTPLCADGSTPLCFPPNSEIIVNKLCSTYLSENSLYVQSITPTCIGNTDNASSPNFKCDHLFSNFSNDYRTGDGEFGAQEEKFWHTNPEDPSTADNGNMDEANVAGLGQNTFTWNYMPGDKIGVAVEGASINPTKWDDSSMMVMWALPKNDFSFENLGYYTKKIKGYDVKIPKASIDWEETLKRNLIDPTQGGQSSKLDVSLSSFPDNPINDGSGNNDGDQLVVNATVTNAVNQNYLKYSWSVYKGKKMNPENWDLLLKKDLPGLEKTSGIGLNSLKLNLNFKESEDIFLKVEVDVSENVSKDVVNKGFSNIIIPLSTTNQKIRAFSSAVKDDLSIDSGEEICRRYPGTQNDDGINGIICPVAKNQLIRLQVKEDPNDQSNNLANIQWTLNGKPLGPIDPSCNLKECTGENGESQNLVYLPILENSGYQYNIGFSALDESTGKNINLTKIFRVMDPQIKISSADENTAKPVKLGDYFDLDGTAYPDLSEVSFTATTDSILKFKPIYQGNFLDNFTWYIDGIPMIRDNWELFSANVDEKGTLSFPATKEEGDFYQIAVKSFYSPSNPVKKLLNKFLGVPLSEFMEKNIYGSIEVKMINSDQNIQASASSNKIMASIFTGFPQYFNFLFKLVITSAGLFFLISIILSLFPKFDDEK